MHFQRVRLLGFIPKSVQKMEKVAFVADKLPQLMLTCPENVSSNESKPNKLTC